MKSLYTFVFFISWGLAAEISRYALIVGINDGGKARVKLKYAVTDAENFAKVFKDMGGVAKDQMILLSNPDMDDFKKGLEKIKNTLELNKDPKKRLELIFYYSGHSDEEGLLIGENKYHYAGLKSSLKAMPADIKIAILDSCASGTLTRLKGGEKKEPFIIDESSKMTGHAFLTSASSDEAAQESDQVGGSFFTHYLVSGLRGGADVNNDGKVTLNEAYEHAFHETLARTEKTQNGPQHAGYDIHLNGSGDLVLTYNRDNSAILFLGKDIYGRLFIRDSNGRLVAEINKKEKDEIQVGLNEGQYDLALDKGDTDGYFKGSIYLKNKQQNQLSMSIFNKKQLEVATARGGTPEKTVVKRSWKFYFEDDGAVHPVQKIRDKIHRKLKPPQNITPTEDKKGALGPQPPHGAYTVFHLGILGFTPISTTFHLSLLGEKIISSRAFTLGLFISRLEVYGGGVMLSSLLNHNQGDFVGIQLTGLGNYNKGEVRGGMIGGLFNISGGPFMGIQLSSIFNVSANILEGSQISTIYNGSRQITGAQIGLVNYTAAKVKGVQIGLVNLGGDVQGAQVGLVNISAKRKGIGIGLFNYVIEGTLNFQTFFDELNMLNIRLNSGDKYVYSLINFSASVINLDKYSLSLGMGVKLLEEKVILNIELATGLLIKAGFDLRQPFHALSSLSVTFGVPLYKNMALFIGLRYNILLEGIDTVGNVKSWLPGMAEITYIQGTIRKITHWPGIYFGMQF